MKKIFFLLFLALSVMSCKDDFSVSNLPDAKPKLVVYCMPFYMAQCLGFNLAPSSIFFLLSLPSHLPLMSKIAMLWLY